MKRKNGALLHAPRRGGGGGGEIRFVLPRTSLQKKSGRGKAARFWFPRQRREEGDGDGEGEGVRSASSGSKRPSPSERGVQARDASVERKSKKARREERGRDGEGPAADDSGDGSLVRSVDDAVRDVAGRRPRANSTDRELNLPRRGLCDERIVLRCHRWDLDRLRGGSARDGGVPVPPPPPRGLTNLGNTCFLNATLQCLAHLPTFGQSIAALPKECYGTIRADDGASEEGPTHGQRVTMHLRSLLRTTLGVGVRPSKPPKTSSIAPKKIHGAITSGKVGGRRFRPGRQGDAHELLVHLLDLMHEGELFAAGINPRMSGWRDKLPIPRLDETTFVHRIFGGYLRSQLKCNKCGHKSNTYDPFLDLALEVSKKHINSLSAAFREYTRVEKLDAENQWKCSGCKKRVCPTKHLSVFRPPLSLCIHLKRFEFGASGSPTHGGGFWGRGHWNGIKGMNMMGNGGSKISKRIEFPAHLSLPLSDRRTCDYLLSGIVVHVGHSATSGHYTSFVRAPGASKSWCHMDDSYVETVSEKTVLKQRDVYVLFYTRKEVKLEFPPPPIELPERKSENRVSTSLGQKKRSFLNPPIEKSQSNLSPTRNVADVAASSSKSDKADGSSSGKKLLYSESKKVGLADIKRSLSYVQKHKSSERPNGFGNRRNFEFEPWDNGGEPKKMKRHRAKHLKLRAAAMNEMDAKSRSKKRKLNLGHWDSLIDEVKRKKVKKHNS